VVPDQYGDPEQEKIADAYVDDAHRIVACVNKCAGFSTEALESPLFVLTDVARDLQELSVKYETVLEQRDELLTSLKEIHGIMIDGQSSYKWFEAFKVADTAITKFKEYK